MRFGVLGPLAAWTSSGELIAVPGAKVRTLLACLLVARGHPVSTDRLIDDLWGDDAPADAAGALQVRVSQLRRALNDAEPGARDLVRSRPPGYLLAADPETVDADRFAALAGRAEGAGDPRDRAALLAEALDLWRGEPYADVADEEFARAAVTRLNEQRLAVTERYAEARLALGEHTLLVGELADLVARHPLRERLRATYLRALYAAGRQSDALESYADLRRRLADELGLDPGPEIAALHRAILEQDPALARRPDRRPEPQPGPPHPEPASAAPRPEPASAPPHPEPASAPPRPTGNLPAPMTELIGREDAVTELAGLLAEPGRTAGGDDDVPIGIAAGGRAGAASRGATE